MRTAAVNRGSGANADTAHVVATGCAVTTAPVTYQWLRNGRTIRGAALPTFRVRRRDRGDLVSVRVTALATAIGPSAQRTSAPVRVRR